MALLALFPTCPTRWWCCQASKAHLLAGTDQPDRLPICCPVAICPAAHHGVEFVVALFMLYCKSSNTKKSCLDNGVSCRVLQIKLAISYALAQSTKLSLHERRVTDMVLETKHLPESLARSGKVSLSPETIAKLIGKVFIQKVRWGGVSVKKV